MTGIDVEKKFTKEDMCRFAEYAHPKLIAFRYTKGDKTEIIYDSEKILKEFLEINNK